MSARAASGNDPLKQYYADRAGEYEHIYDKPERQADLTRLKALLLPLFAGREVLDVACGTAWWTAVYAPVARRVTGVDANAETLAVAAAKAWPPGRVTFTTGDAYALGDESANKLGSFDAAFAGFWWSHIPVRERPRFFSGLHARLRPGARVVLLDNLFVMGSSTPISRRDADGNLYQQRRLADGSRHEVLKNFPSAEALAAEVAACARDVRYTSLEYFWLFSYIFTPPPA